MTTTAEAQVEADKETQPLALGYVRAHLLMTEDELADAKGDLANTPSSAGLMATSP